MNWICPDRLYLALAEAIEWVAAARAKGPGPVKVETGMGRIGVPAEEGADFIARLKRSTWKSRGSLPTLPLPTKRINTWKRKRFMKRCRSWRSGT